MGFTDILTSVLDRIQAFLSGAAESTGAFFRKKRKLEADIFDETGRIIIKNVQYENNTFVTKIGSQLRAYIVDENEIHYNAKTRMPVSFYNINDPNPIHLVRGVRNKENIDPVGFKKILDSKVVADLFSDEAKDLFFWILLLAGAAAVFSLLIALKVYNIVKWQGG